MDFIAQVHWEFYYCITNVFLRFLKHLKYNNEFSCMPALGSSQSVTKAELWPRWGAGPAAPRGVSGCGGSQSPNSLENGLNGEQTCQILSKEQIPVLCLLLKQGKGELRQRWSDGYRMCPWLTGCFCHPSSWCHISFSKPAAQITKCH